MLETSDSHWRSKVFFAWVMTNFCNSLLLGNFSDCLQIASASFQTTRQQPNNRSSTLLLLISWVKSVLISSFHLLTSFIYSTRCIGIWPDKMKTKRIDIRMTEYEFRQLDSEAERRGMTRAELIRSIVARLPEPNIKPSSKDGACTQVFGQNLFDLTPCTTLKNRQDACSTKNGARCQFYLKCCTILNKPFLG